jgi:hypothetical protein
MLRFGLGGLSDRTFGVLRPTLYPSGYDWALSRNRGKPFTDTGHGTWSRPGPAGRTPLPALPPGVERPLDDLLVLSRTHAASSSFGPSRRPRGWTNLLSPATLLGRRTHR